MEYKTPKVLEKKPIIAGFDLKIIVLSAVFALLILFTVFKSFLLALLFFMIWVIYLRIEKKYPKKGQLKMIVKYRTGIQCTRINLPLKSIIKIK